MCVKIEAKLVTVFTCVAMGWLLGEANLCKAQEPPSEPPPVEASGPTEPASAVTTETKTVTTVTTKTMTTEAETAPQNEAPGQQADFASFHEQLGPYGEWMQTPDGWVWRPAVPPGWRPYYDGGHWTYTDTGWYWQSDYPWGDIAFHYGRWSFRSGMGWIWTPAYEFAPAWVYWRHADGYLGWAPLPAGAVFAGGVWHFHGAAVAVDFDFGLTPGFFTFVEYGHFWEHDFRHFVVPRERLAVIYRTSVIINNYRVDERGRFINEGLGRERIQALTHHEVRAIAAHELRAQENHEHFIQRQNDLKIVKAGGKIQADRKMASNHGITGLKKEPTASRNIDSKANHGATSLKKEPGTSTEIESKANHGATGLKKEPGTSTEIESKANHGATGLKKEPAASTEIKPKTKIQPTGEKQNPAQLNKSPDEKGKIEKEPDKQP